MFVISFIFYIISFVLFVVHFILCWCFTSRIGLPDKLVQVSSPILLALQLIDIKDFQYVCSTAAVLSSAAYLPIKYLKLKHFNWHFIQISIGISLNFQLDFQWITINISLKFLLNFNWISNWIPLVFNYNFNWISNWFQLVLYLTRNNVWDTCIWRGIPRQIPVSDA